MPIPMTTGMRGSVMTDMRENRITYHNLQPRKTDYSTYTAPKPMQKMAKQCRGNEEDVNITLSDEEGGQATVLTVALNKGQNSMFADSVISNSKKNYFSAINKQPMARQTHNVDTQFRLTFSDNAA